MRYGHFDDIQREYVITRPDTPLPWLNYLGSERYFALLSNTAGGYSFYRDARLRRLTRYRYNNVPSDSGGRYLYLREAESGEFWSPTWQPTQTELDEYTCRHGLGYSTIQSKYRGVSASVCYFVPPGADLEIWDVTLVNQRLHPIQLDLFSALEFNLWDAWDDGANFQRNFSTGEVEIEEGVIYHKTEYRERRNHFAYFACSAPVSGYDTQREAFLGAYRGWNNPQAVAQGRATNSKAHGWAPIGSHQVQLTLEPGVPQRVIFLLGYWENPVEAKFDPPDSLRINKQGAREVIQYFLDPARVDQAFVALGQYWQDLLGNLQVETPDETTNRIVNTWNAYQCMVTFNLSRSASFFESGIGRGMGFRDSNQDLLGFVHMAPERARQRLLDLAATQLHNGGAFHQYQPLTKRGNDAVGSNFNDDPLWLVLAVGAYIRETGDASILDEAAPYENRPGSEQPLYDHLERAIQYTLDRKGPHGLPLIGRADWNDCLNLNTFSTEPGESFQTTTNKDGQTAESVFIAGLFTLAANEMADLAELRQDPGSASVYRQNAAAMAEVTLEQGWDGEWFRRAYDDNGDPLGSHLNEEGQIFIEPQGMCVMAGIGLEGGQAERALEAVAQRLATPHGIVLQQPAFSRYYLHLGEISSYPPGYKENAGIFCHTNPWIMIAETVLGHGDRAYDYYQRINPAVREPISDLHRCEPYVYAQMIAGRDAPSFGEAKNSWLSGTAAWNYVAITQHILGIRPTLQGLQVKPALPARWPGYSAIRRYRGATYHIHVTRSGAGNSVKIVVAGQTIQGDVIPLPSEPGGEVRVEVSVA